MGILLFYLICQPILEATGGTVGKIIIVFKTINLSSGEPPSIINSYGRSAINLLYFMLLVMPAMLSGLAVLWSKKNKLGMIAPLTLS